MALRTKYNFWPDDYPVLQSTEDCVRAYSVDLLAGALHDEAAVEELAASEYHLDADSVLHETGMADTGKGKLTTNGRFLRQLDPGLYSEQQETGDCVSMATRNACDETRACEILLGGELELWIARGATEPIYGARGHSGQGANCATLANWVTTKSGLLVRKNYPELGIDLSQYNARIGMNWGGRGVPDAVRAEGAKHPFRFFSIIKSAEQARDFAANGYGLFWCAGIAYSSTRDEWGVAKRIGGGWAHSQHIGYLWDDTPEFHQRYGTFGFGTAQSWGIRFANGGWNVERYGPAHGSISILPGSIFNEVLRNGWIAAIGDFNGFERRIERLTDLGAGTYL